MDNGSNILVGWKAIASYLGCSVRTAWRKAKRRSLPVSTDEDGRVRALRDDIDAWVRKSVRKTTPKRH